MSHFAETPVRGQRTTGTKGSFRDLETARSRLTGPSLQTPQPTGRQNFAGSNASRQIVGDALRNPAEIRDKPPAVSGDHPAMSALRATLDALGLSTSGLDLQYKEEMVDYPGGSYTNRLITATGPDGHVENFDAALTLKNPEIAATEIASYFRLRS